MGSVDGKVLVERWSQPFDGTPMMNLMKIYSEIGNTLNTDAWTFGKNTICEIFPEKFQGSAEFSAQLSTSVFKGKLTSPHMFVAIDQEADIKYTANNLRGDDILVLVGLNASTEYLAYLRNLGISYIVVEDVHNLADILETINREFGIGSITLRGGGVLNAGMLQQGMVDELSYVIYPGIDGTSDSVSIFHYMGDAGESPMASQSLELLSVEKKENGVVWLRYKVHKLQG